MEILNELKTISPLLAGMEKLNVFTVPEGYFEGLTASILSGLKDADSAILQGINKQDNNEVPEGYFDNLAENILMRVKALQPAGSTNDPAELSPLLKSLQSINVFNVPAGYFDSLEQEISAKWINESAANELRALSPMLYDIQNINVFEAPQGYFDNLSDDILDRVEKKPAKLVAMPRRSNIFKYAAAAAITGLMLFAGYKIINPDADGKLHELTDVQKKGLEINKNGTFEKEMDNLSDDAILKYLQSSGGDVDAALVASTVDEKELPSQEDYLLDDKTLDNFLNNIDDKDLNN